MIQALAATESISHAARVTFSPVKGFTVGLQIQDISKFTLFLTIFQMAPEN